MTLSRGEAIHFDCTGAREVILCDPAAATNKLPAVRIAGLTHVGPYDGLEDAYAAVFTWLNEHGYQGTFPTREISLNDPAVTPPEKLVTDILIPIGQNQ